MHEWFYAIRKGFGTRFNVVTRTMDLWVFVNNIGGQGGDINVPWERWKPNLGIGSVVSLDHPHPCCLCSASTWWKEVKQQWLDRYDGSIVSQHNLLVWFDYWHTSHHGFCLVMVGYGSVAKWTWITACGKIHGKIHNLSGKPVVQVFTFSLLASWLW